MNNKYKYNKYEGLSTHEDDKNSTNLIITDKY